MADINVTGEPRARDQVWENTGFRLSWGAIFAGAVVATVLQITLALLGIGLGFLGWNPGDPLSNLGTGALIWFGVTAILTLFVGGLTTGRLAGVLTPGDGALHGIVMWSISTLLATYLIWKVLSFAVGSALGLVGGAVSTTAGALASGLTTAGAAALGQAGNIDPNQLQGQIESILRETGNPALQPDSLQAQIQQAQGAATSGASNQALANDIISQIQRTGGQVRREDLINVITARSDLTRPEAERLATRIEAAAGNARQQISTTVDTLSAQASRTAQNVADDLKAAMVRAAWAALLAMGLSLAAAAWGATMTARE